MRLPIGKSRRALRAKKEGKKNERGFTLIETCIALIVMMVAALAAGSLFIYAVNYNSGANDRAVALAIAQQRMEKLRKSSFDEVVSSSDADVESANRHFSVDVTVTGTTLKSITVTVTPKGVGASWVNNPVIVMSQRSTTATGSYY